MCHEATGGCRIIAVLIPNGQCHVPTALSPEKGPSSYL